MRIIETTPQTYSDVFSEPTNVFCGVPFSELNKHKVDRLRYLLFENEKIRLGIILGQRGNDLCSPFSAPFGGLCLLRTQMAEVIDEAAKLLHEYAERQRMRVILTLPPQCYDDRQNAEIVNALWRYGKIAYININHHFDIKRFEHYDELLNSKTRNKLKQALQQSFDVVKVTDDNGARSAYEIIRRNREERSHPLHISVKDMLDTIKIIHTDIFLLAHKEENIAAAIVYHVKKDVAQVVYWGDLHEYARMRTMNMLAYRVFEYYYNKQSIRLLDIGTSSVDGTPDYGLCNFKTSIGCVATPKYTFML